MGVDGNCGNARRAGTTALTARISCGDRRLYKTRTLWAESRILKVERRKLERRSPERDVNAFS
jgi:hypothetical protein